jgi:hypothetical protein
VDSDEGVRLFGLGIDALRDVDDPDPEELKLLHDADRVRNVAGDARTVVDQQDVERLRLLLRRGEQALHACPADDARPRNRGVGVDAITEDSPPTLGGVALCHGELVVDGGLPLEIRAVTGVARNSHGHHLKRSTAAAASGQIRERLVDRRTEVFRTVDRGGRESPHRG